MALPRRIPKERNRSERWRSQELQALLSYDEASGKLFWRQRQRAMFTSERSFSTWNARFSGKEAFTANHSEGYKAGTILGRTDYAHRIIAVMVWGSADGEIDHINGDRSDNRLCNLRLVTREENRMNVKVQANSPHGAHGIYQRGERWFATIQHDGWARSLGSFSTKAEAISARKDAEANLGFHPNHGRA